MFPPCYLCVCVSCSVLSDPWRPYGLWPASILCLWDSPGKNTGVDCHYLLQGNFQTQGSSAFEQILQRLSYRKVKSLSCVQLFATPWTIAHQAPLSMGYLNKNTGVGCHFLLQGDLSDPGIEPMSPASPALAGGFFTTEPPGKPFSWILLPQNSIS